MRKNVSFACAALAVLLCAGTVAAQERSLRFEKTVDWQLGKPIALNATVGPVRVASVEFRKGEPGGGGPGGAILGRLRGASETEATVTAAFDTENPSADEWVVTYTVDFLDAKGKLIDRASGKEEFEGEADVYRLDHAILEYVLPFVDRVKVRLEAKYD
ncbi:MAG TPA: hypothetical protein VNJ70_20445 [Thermoanaerobaculia bacterium]|nr:hypothetical protein [Thermoanaerobaculia bacterium]